MEEAIKLALRAYEEDEIPVGAVVTYENRVIAKGYNQVEKLNDPTAHAEMIAITAACEYLKTKWLYNCTLYVTLEPCIMCAGALILSRIDNIVFGALDPKSGAFGSKLDINSLKLNHRIKVSKGILEDNCSHILKEFFKNRRK
ncbi:MAG: tRNA adenosine(34) deaminase TadA [Candidatus Omnitrophica bacterium]|nr:tRNA adenosine(34) deaminase TadA [Candidatus Omnitrophota bacterium]MCM8826052.1 tRNA adenosine(34) deaminase TadA [Candidatus Omnitrophota bacterium]